MGTAFGDGAKMSDIISKIPSSMLVNDTSDAAQVNKALLNQVQSSNKIIDAVNTVNAAVTAVGSGIVELGTNSNGTYIKWGNGLMMCYFTQNQSGLVVNVAQGNGVYSSLGVSWTFPSSYSSVPLFFKNTQNSNGIFEAIDGSSSSSVTVTAGTYRILYTAGSSTFIGDVVLFAIGTWK